MKLVNWIGKFVDDISNCNLLGLTMTLAQFAFLQLYYTNKIYLGFLGIAVVTPRIMACVRTP
jgi:hypothetical protein